MKRSGETASNQPSTGFYIGRLLNKHPAAITAALDKVAKINVPVDERPIDAPDLCRSFSGWAAVEYPEGDDLTERRNVVWGGIHWAYTVARSASADYIPSLRVTRQLSTEGGDERYEAIVADGFAGALDYPVLMKAAGAGMDYIDPAGNYPLMAQLGALAGFTMIDNNESKKEHWRELFYKDLARTREQLSLEEMWDVF